MKKIIYIGFLSLVAVPVYSQTIGEILGGVEKVTGIKTSGTKTNSSTSNVDLSNLGSNEISTALKQALNMGVEEGIDKLSVQDGYLKNEMVKILMPEELRKVENVLRSFGLSSLADESVKLFNRAAEDAVSEAAPIFASAITSMSFDDAKNILLSGDNAATDYLEFKTSDQLYNAFEPKVQASLGKVGADKVWTKLITSYNMFTGKNVTTNLNQYVTEQALNGVFKMVAEKESGIRNNAVFRTTSVLQDVFGALDKK